MRIPKEFERIAPPLVDIYVPSGYRDKKEINRPEAEAIADEIDVILQNKKFSKRTLGIVSLLGPDQARHIDTVVRSRCDAAELMRHKFECGDARVFQGSERGIMFLSMVVDPQSCRAISGNTAEQRFNVAGNWARDRMYLVRSVQLSDLSHLDLRARMLSHFNMDVTRFCRHKSTSSMKLLERKRAHLVKMTVPADSTVETLDVIEHD